MMKYSIVGQRFKGLDPYLPGIKAGTPVQLVREPANPADRNAVAVYVDGKPVGYIPKKDNAELARKIDASGMAMDATLIRSPNSAYPQVEVV
jgi:HIRAN domain